MDAVKTILKTYAASLSISYIYLWLIHEKFESHEPIMIMLVMLIANLVACVAYVIGILLPFGFLFRPSLACSDFKEALHQYLIYFSLLPAIGWSFCIGIALQNAHDGVQFSLMVINFSSIIYLGLIHFLKYQTTA